MSQGVNRVFLIGNLGADPEMRATQSGTPVCDLRLATSRKWTDRNGEQREEVEWHKLVVWDKLATICQRYLVKGSKVYAEGRLKTRKWQDREGRDRWTTEVVARTVVFLSTTRQADPVREQELQSYGHTGS